VKETAIPAIIGLAVVGSLFTRYPLIRLLVYSKELFDVNRIQGALRVRNSEQAMEQLLQPVNTSALGLLLPQCDPELFLASAFVKTEPSIDAAQFNAEVGAMTGWSYVVIALPSTLFIFGILYLVIRGIHKHAGLTMQEALAPHLREEESSSDPQ
jgi:hypothetical protein